MGSQPETGEGLSGDLQLLPWPASLDRGSGVIRLASARFQAAADGVVPPRLARAVERLGERISRRCGLPLAEPVPVQLRWQAAAAGLPVLGADEGYWLVADDAGLYVDAASEWGVLWGLVTLGQLVAADGTIPHIAVDDRPRFPWRGLLLDPARHFLPAADVLRTLDGMACCKLNVLHLHLSDDQGFRFPVPALPKLASRDAYTAQELAAVVSHAADLGIRVVPEIDMPGHVTSWLTAYPELGARQVGLTERFGVHGACLDPSSEAVYDAIGRVLDALVAVFPDECVHIGGDEVSPGWWSEDPNVRALMDRESLPDVKAVQGYFNRRVGAMVAQRGRRVVAWDEVLEAGCPGDWIVQAWRGATLRDRVLAAGNRVLVSAPYYLDLHYPVDVHYGFDPAAPQAALVAREDELLTDPRFAPVAEGMRWAGHWRQGAIEREPPSNDPALLGGEACLWGELVAPAVLDTRLWSRLPAVAERFWSTADRMDADRLYPRLDRFLDGTLREVGIDVTGGFEAALAALGVGNGWREVVGMLEPVKWYGRLLGAEALAARIQGREMPQARPYLVDTPLDALVDHLPPESRPARRFAMLCRAAEGGDESASRTLARKLAGWRALAAGNVPADLAAPLDRLLTLAGLVESRLETGATVGPQMLDALGAPMGELVLALPPALQSWLTGR
ncbi:MAG: beta-N-acetylhexosaminidase [Pseudomonadales bacterium]